MCVTDSKGISAGWMVVGWAGAGGWIMPHCLRLLSMTYISCLENLSHFSGFTRSSHFEQGAAWTKAVVAYS